MTSIERLRTIKQGHHGCLFYDDAEKARRLTAEFIRIGLERGERCLYLADPLSLAAFTLLLKDSGMDVNREVSRGALELSSERAHLVDGRFNGENLLNLLDRAVEHALKAGFTGLRATGDIIWELGSDVDMQKLAEYELLLDHFFLGKPLTGLCQYNVNVVHTDYLRCSLLCHNAVVFDETVTVNNGFYRSASKTTDSFHSMLSTLSAPGI